MDANGTTSTTAPVDEAPLHRLLGSLPAPLARGFHALRQHGRRWVRVPLGVLCVGGGFLWFLPVLGLWMLPVGMILLAEDMPVIKRPAMRGLGAVQAWWDRRREWA
ncbi:MAG: hypothetical protein ACRYHQ_34540 [Janthinobacterium lividum]